MDSWSNICPPDRGKPPSYDRPNASTRLSENRRFPGKVRRPAASVEGPQWRGKSTMKPRAPRKWPARFGLVLLLAHFSSNAATQETNAPPTRAEILKGALTPERTCYHV